VIRKKSIGLVKVQWTYYGHGYATWEHDETMLEEYPQVFVDFEENKS
jgi:hypothetical protein